MSLFFNVNISGEKTRIEFRGGAASIEILDAKEKNRVVGGENSFYFLVNEGNLVYVGKTATGNRDHRKKSFDQYIIVSAPQGIDIGYLEMYYTRLAIDCGIELVNKVMQKIPKQCTENKKAEAEDFASDVESILVKFGFDFFSRNTYRNNRDCSIICGRAEIHMTGNTVEIFENGTKYEGVKIEKLHELATKEGIDFSSWKKYEKRGAIGFALRLKRELRERS